MAVQDQNPDNQTGPSEKHSPITHEAIERLKKISEQIIQDRGGKLFEDSVGMIRQMREERSRYLEQLHEQAATDEASTTQQQGHPITPETVQRVLRVRERLMQDSKGEFFEDAADMLRQQREERIRYLEQVYEQE